MDAVANVDDHVDSEVTEDPTGRMVDPTPLVDEEQPFSRYRKVIDLDGQKVLIRIPNQFQRKTMKDEADAARARKLRELRDPNTTSYLAVESQLEQIYGDFEDEQLRNALLGKAQPIATSRAQMEIEHADPKKHPEWTQFSNVERQQMTYDRLLRSEQTDTDEFRSVEKLLVDYAHVLSGEVEEALEPLRMKLEDMERDALLEDLRKALMRDACDEAFMEAYNQWQVYFGTRYEGQQHKQFYPSFDKLLDEDAETLGKLMGEFAMLEALNIDEMRRFLAAMPS